MGNVNDKMSKLKGIVFGQWAICKGQNTVDYEDSPLEPGIKILYKPMGVIGCVMPSTNPVATIIGNAMIALKGRNSVIIAPHPMSVRLSVKMVKLLREALESVGAPADLIQCISEEYASREATNLMMSTCDACISTGGAGRVKAAYSSGKPAFGVGQGNVQEIVDLGISDAELERQATLCVAHRAKDNGVPCAGARPYISMPSSWSSGRDTCRSMALSSLIRMKILRPFVLWCSLTVAPSSTEQLWASSPIRWAKCAA